MQKNKKYVLAFLLMAMLSSVFYFSYSQFYLPHKFSRMTKQILRTATLQMDESTLAGQALHIAIPGKEITDASRQILRDIKPGGIIFFGFNLESAAQIQKFTRELQDYAKELEIPPFLISTDQEGGYVKRVRDGVLQTPPARSLGDMKDSALCRATGFFVSHDLGKLGINVFFAPIVDINNNLKNPVIGLRSFGADLTSVLDCALPFEEGARAAQREGGALPVIKHFPGHGDTTTDSHWALPVIEKDLATLRSFELIPFTKAIKNGAKAVMTAHILYPKIDAEHPATLSTLWLTKILRGDLAFDGVVFTDAMEMNAVNKAFKTLDRPVVAIKAGADILLYTSWHEEPREAKERILAAIQNGTLKRGYTKEETPLALERAIENQLRQKLPFIEISKYLSAEDARWYSEYRKKRLAKSKSSPLTYTRHELKDKFKTVVWPTKNKSGGPVWLAGEKNNTK